MQMLGGVLLRIIESDAYIRFMRPLDDEGTEQLDRWTLTIDGAVTLSEDEKRAFESEYQARCAHQEWFATNPRRCVRCQKTLD